MGPRQYGASPGAFSRPYHRRSALERERNPWSLHNLREGEGGRAGAPKVVWLLSDGVQTESLGGDKAAITQAAESRTPPVRRDPTRRTCMPTRDQLGLGLRVGTLASPILRNPPHTSPKLNGRPQPVGLQTS